MVEAGIHRYSVGTEMSRLLATSSSGNAAGEQLLCGFDLAVGHLPFAATFAAELASHFETGAGSFNVASHLNRAVDEVWRDEDRAAAG